MPQGRPPSRGPPCRGPPCRWRAGCARREAAPGRSRGAAPAPEPWTCAPAWHQQQCRRPPGASPALPAPGQWQRQRPHPRQRLHVWPSGHLQVAACHLPGCHRTCRRRPAFPSALMSGASLRCLRPRRRARTRHARKPRRCACPLPAAGPGSLGRSFVARALGCFSSCKAPAPPAAALAAAASTPAVPSSAACCHPVPSEAPWGSAPCGCRFQRPPGTTAAACRQLGCPGQESVSCTHCVPGRASLRCTRGPRGWQVGPARARRADLASAEALARATRGCSRSPACRQEAWRVVA
mmetsp:Transcript_141293/g.393784  ORF Transcript_141293/g.393784 Transcript_141293/m.393784 type:complete len:295 (-) Transcript_141293:107-991(-)